MVAMIRLGLLPHSSNVLGYHVTGNMSRVFPCHLAISRWDKHQPPA